MNKALQDAFVKLNPAYAGRVWQDSDDGQHLFVKQDGEVDTTINWYIHQYHVADKRSKKARDIKARLAENNILI